MGEKVKIGTLWRRVSATSGREYFSGYFGSASMVLFKDDAESEAKGADVWAIFVETRQAKEKAAQDQEPASPAPAPRRKATSVKSGRRPAAGPPLSEDPADFA